MRGHAFRPFGGDQAAVIASDDVRQDVSWFADDVVIDFPSVARAVERIRKSFLGEEHLVTFRSTVAISLREALMGATVPLEVPVQCTCAACGGRGESWTEPCVRCSGHGIELLRHLLQVTVPAGVTDGARFCFTVTPRHNPPTRIELRVAVDSRAG